MKCLSVKLVEKSVMKKNDKYIMKGGLKLKLNQIKGGKKVHHGTDN